MANISKHIYMKLKEGRGPVTVISDGTKFSFDSVEEAKAFWKDCYYNSEGSEQSRYAEILMQLDDGATNISDGTDDLVPGGSKLFGEYNDVKKTNKYKIFNGYKDPENKDYTPTYKDYTIGGENDHHKTAEDWLMFFRGHDLARNKDAWKEFSNEMNNAGYDKELGDLKTRIENGYGVKLESIKPNVELSQDRLKTLLYNAVGALLCGDYAGVTTEEVADYLGSSVDELVAIHNSNDRLAVLVDNAISGLQGGGFEEGASEEEIARYLGCSVKELKGYGALTESVDILTTFINKYKPLYDTKPFMKDGVLWADNIALRGSGISKRVGAKYEPGQLEVYNEEWGFLMVNGSIDFESMKNMSQYWFFNDYETDEDFKTKIDKSAKSLYKDMANLYDNMKSESGSLTEGENQGNFIIYVATDTKPDYWTGSGFSKKESEAMEFESDDEAENCKKEEPRLSNATITQRKR